MVSYMRDSVKNGFCCHLGSSVLYLLYLILCLVYSGLELLERRIGNQPLLGNKHIDEVKVSN